MAEYLEFIQAPNFEIVEDIMTEARERFLGVKIDLSSLAEMEFFMNQRAKEEIDKGNFRTTFITPANRVAKFECIIIRQDEIDKSKIGVVPRWVYIDEEETGIDELTI